MNITEFVKSYIDHNTIGDKKFCWRRLPADGSRRIFYRLINNKVSIVVMINPPAVENAEKENLSFLKIGNHLFERGIPVPRIYNYDLSHGWFIMDDLGIDSLQEASANSNDIIPLYKNVIELLINMQFEGRKYFNPKWCYHTKKYDRFIMERFESGYFLTYFIKGFVGLEQGVDELQEPFKYLACQASFADSNYFLHRDFQSRNLIVNKNSIGVIDWQGGRLGPLQYDLASLLIDPYVEIKKHDRKVLYNYYITLLENNSPGAYIKFNRYYPYLSIQRNLQILGAFSYLGNTQGKTGFLSFIPPALRSLQDLLAQRNDKELYPLKKMVDGICDKFI